MSVSAASRSRKLRPSPGDGAQRVALHQLVGGLARPCPLRTSASSTASLKYRPPVCSRFSRMRVGVDDQAVDQAGGARGP